MANAGDIDHTYALLVIDAVTKTNTAVTKGDVVGFDTDGWAPAAQAAGPGPTMGGVFGVSLDTEEAVAATQKAIRVMLKGAIYITKTTGTAIEVGEAVGLTATAGAVNKWTIADVGATPDQASINDAIADVTEKVGQCIEAAASADTIVLTLLDN